MEEQQIHNQNQSLIQEQELGFELQATKTSSFSSQHSLQNPPHGDDDEDDTLVQSICEELQNLVLNQAFDEERRKNEENGVAEIKNETFNEKSENGVVGVEWSDEGGGDESEGDDYMENGNGNGNEGCYVEGRFSANRRRMKYPLRPDAEDCAYYMKTGMCRYGFNCKFNHPPRRGNQGGKEKGMQNEEIQERSRQIACKYYLKSGGCKYGKACKFYHRREKVAVSPILEFNFLGLPIRLGEKECPYYMRTGSCKYGSNCRFHHPDPTVVSDLSSGYSNGGYVPVLGASHPTVSSWSSPMMYPLTQDIPSPNLEWSRYQAPVYPTSEKSLPTPPAFTMNDPSSGLNFYARLRQPLLVEEYPERPGQPDCSYFIKTGDCKYKYNCKYHHPKAQRSEEVNSSVLNDKGLPLRPDQGVCSYYSRYGICKYGPACKFDHPEHYDSSSSSTEFGFDQPPAGNSATTDGSRMARQGNVSGSLMQQSV